MNNFIFLHRQLLVKKKHSCLHTREKDSLNKQKLISCTLYLLSQTLPCNNKWVLRKKWLSLKQGQIVKRWCKKNNLLSYKRTSDWTSKSKISYYLPCYRWCSLLLGVSLGQSHMVNGLHRSERWNICVARKPVSEVLLWRYWSPCVLSSLQ